MRSDLVVCPVFFCAILQFCSTMFQLGLWYNPCNKSSASLSNSQHSCAMALCYFHRYWRIFMWLMKQCKCVDAKYALFVHCLCQTFYSYFHLCFFVAFFNFCLSVMITYCGGKSKYLTFHWRAFFKHIDATLTDCLWTMDMLLLNLHICCHISSYWQDCRLCILRYYWPQTL